MLDLLFITDLLFNILKRNFRRLQIKLQAKSSRTETYTEFFPSLKQDSRNEQRHMPFSAPTSVGEPVPFFIRSRLSVPAPSKKGSATGSRFCSL